MTLRQWLYRKVYLQSPYWKWLRRKVAKRADYICEVKGCNEIGRNLDAHHSTYKIYIFGFGISILFLEWLFLRKMYYLCRLHHNQTHAGRWLEIKKRGTLKAFGVKR